MKSRAGFEHAGRKLVPKPSKAQSKPRSTSYHFCFAFQMKLITKSFFKERLQWQQWSSY
jgi:hypothetical protein